MLLVSQCKNFEPHCNIAILRFCVIYMLVNIHGVLLAYKELDSSVEDFAARYDTGAMLATWRY